MKMKKERINYEKTIALFLVFVMLMSLLAGCGRSNADVDPVGGLTEKQLAMLEELGIPKEQFDAMSEEEKQAVLTELGMLEDYMQQEQQTKPPKETTKKYTVNDVYSGGKYVVRIGDGWLNNYWLYYEDGKLVKVEISFQKSSEEEPETYVFEGDNLSEFWYYDKTLDELISYFDQQGYGYTHSVKPL